jgi:hypothetical protein
MAAPGLCPLHRAAPGIQPGEARRGASNAMRAGEQAMPCAPGSPQKNEFRQV